MITKQNCPIGVTSWLSTLSRCDGGGYSKYFYEPESIQELEDLCSYFFARKFSFDLIGHTSNTLYTPDYVCERMVSTRKLNYFKIKEDRIECECGTSVRALALAAIKVGIKGFEGLVDLPGTVGAALYGNASCYGCSIASLLKVAIILNSDGTKEKVSSEWFGFAKRSSVLKRREKKAVILSIVLHRENGDAQLLQEAAERNHAKRRATQPEPKNSLGSIFANSGKPTILNRVLMVITKPYSVLLKLVGKNEKEIKQKQKKLIFALLGARDVEPYVRTWNWYQWRDERSHALFWKYVKLHRLMFTRSDFEIEIKHNSNFKIP